MLFFLNIVKLLHINLRFGKKKNYGYSLIFPVNFSYIHTEYKINIFSEKKNQNTFFFSNRIEESKMFKS